MGRNGAALGGIERYWPSWVSHWASVRTKRALPSGLGTWGLAKKEVPATTSRMLTGLPVRKLVVEPSTIAARGNGPSWLILPALRNSLGGSDCTFAARLGGSTL